MHNLNSARATLSSLTEGQAKVFKIGRYRYAFGLHWQTPDDPKSMTKEAKRLARMDGFRADLYLERRKTAPQFALGRSSEGLLAGAIGAAAVAAQALRGTSAWLGVFRLGDGFWFVSVRDDFVLPDGDCYYEDETEARTRFDREKRLGGWLRYYAPEDWMDGAEEVPVTQFLGLERGPTLCDVNPFDKRFKTIATAALLLGAISVGLYTYYTTHKQAKTIAAATASTEEINRLLASQRVAIMAPWADRPEPSKMVNACLNGMRHLPTSAPGYTFHSLACTSGGEVSSAFERDRGVAGWFDAWAKTLANQTVDGSNLSGEAEPTGKTGTIRVSITPPQARMASPGWTQQSLGLYDIATAEKSIRETSQVMGDQLDLSALQRSKENVGTTDKAIKPKWASTKFSIATRDPDAWATYFNNFPGVVVDGVRFDAGTSMWRIEGEIYVRSN